MLNPLGSGSSRLLSPLGMASGVTTYQQKVLALNPLAYWPLNGNANDVSGNGYNGTPTAITWDAIANPGATMGSAPFFNGSTSFISANANSLTTYSVLAWVRFTALLVGAAVVGGRVNVANGFLQPGGSLRPQFNTALATLPNAFVINTWYCLAGTHDNTNTDKIFIGGAEKASGNGTAALLPILIGKRVDNLFVTGYISHVAIFNSALSGAAIADLAIAS